MSERVLCKECKASILLSTSKRTNGLCMPCKNGYRKNIEEAKKYYTKEKELNNTCPFRALWRELVDKVYKHKNGFDDLSNNEKLYYAVNVLKGEVYNGGFTQYFYNSSKEHCMYVKKGLARLNAVFTLKLLHEAKEELFGNNGVPINMDKRYCIIQQNLSNPKLDKLDKLFYKNTDNLDDKLEAFAIDVNLAIKGV
jgi:hypothetical protein